MDQIDVKGESMRPFLLPGDQVGVHWLNPLDRSVELQPGEIVIARESSRSQGETPEWIIHRVIRKMASPGPGIEMKIWTRGDAALGPEQVTMPQIWARVHSIGNQSFRVGALDRLIAKFSAEAHPAGSFRARLLRKAVFALGWIRRRTLERTRG